MKQNQELKYDIIGKCCTNKQPTTDVYPNLCGHLLYNFLNTIWGEIVTLSHENAMLSQHNFDKHLSMCMFI